MKLYGTTTSPFVRRVRVVAQEVGEPIERIDTASDAGQAQLREVSAIRKVPVAVVGDLTLFDSRAIVDWLTATHGWGTLAQPRDRWRDLNLLNAIDAALESVISLYYLRRDGVPIDGTPFATRQLERTAAIFQWVTPQLSTEAFGLPELAALTAADWMDFRGTYETARVDGLTQKRAAWSDRPSVVATLPHA